MFLVWWRWLINQSFIVCFVPLLIGLCAPAHFPLFFLSRLYGSRLWYNYLLMCQMFIVSFVLLIDDAIFWGLHYTTNCLHCCWFPFLNIFWEEGVGKGQNKWSRNRVGVGGSCTLKKEVIIWTSFTVSMKFAPSKLIIFLCQ